MVFLSNMHGTKLLKDKKVKTVFHCFIGIVNGSKGKLNKLWVDQGRELYNDFYAKVVR